MKSTSLIAATLAISLIAVRPASAAPWVTAYLPAWEVSQNGVAPSKIDMKSITDLVWFSLNPTPSGDVVEGGNPGIEKFASSVAEAAHRAHKKALICIGGAGTAPDFAAAFQGHTPQLVNSIATWVKLHGYDGVDIDDEPLQPADSQNYQRFIQSLRAALPKGAVLTAAVEPFGASISTFGPIAKDFDQVNIMTYDMIYGNNLVNGPGKMTWYNAPLYGGRNLEQSGGKMPTVVLSLSRYESAPVAIPASKLGIGAAFYGYVFPGTTNSMQAYQGTFPPTDLSYADIMAKYYQPGAYNYDTTCQSAYISRKDTGNFVTFDDPRAVAAKVRFVKANGLGGLVCFEVGHQYMGGKNPLLKAIDSAL
jgi:chitinase